MRAWLMTLCLSSFAVQSAPIPGQGTWGTTLIARDVNKDGTVDAYFDRDLKITWLADANQAGTSGYVPPGGFTFWETAEGVPRGALDLSHATSWAAGLNLYGITGWRLPTARASCGEFSCSLDFSELAHLNEVTLGNTSHGPVNTGPFANVLGTAVWGGILEHCPINPPEGPGCFEYLNFGSQNHGFTDEAIYAGFAWAVHEGDIAAIPEPGTYPLMLIGLGVVSFVARRGIRHR